MAKDSSGGKRNCSYRQRRGLLKRRNAEDEATIHRGATYRSLVSGMNFSMSRDLERVFTVRVLITQRINVAELWGLVDQCYYPMPLMHEMGSSCCYDRQLGQSRAISRHTLSQWHSD